MPRLDDFDIGTFEGPSSWHRPINMRTRALVEEVRFALVDRPPVKAPFGKLLIELYFEAEPPRWNANVAGGVAIVPWKARVEDVLAPRERRIPAVLEYVDGALEVLERDIDWSAEPVRRIVRELRARDDLGWIELGYAKRDRATGRTVTLFCEVEDEGWSVWALVLDPDGRELRRERLADAETAARPLVESAFPVRSAVFDGRAVVFRDRDRQPLARVSFE